MSSYDPHLKLRQRFIKYLLTHKDDDYLLLCAGDTGSGKSMLMLHVMDEFMGEYADTSFIGLTRSSFADAFTKIRNVPKEFRFLANDEANISKREALTKYNRDLLDLYYSCRGLNIFHWWNNPSVDMIDKPFIKDRVKGFILIVSKDVKRPRAYYFFTKENLLRILDKYGDIELKTIRKVRKKYSSFKGWFRDYDGRLKKPYLDMKNPRMLEKVDEFQEKYGKEVNGFTEEYYPSRKVALLTGYKSSYVAELCKKGFLVEDEDFKKGPGGRIYNQKAVAKLLERRTTAKYANSGLIKKGDEE